MELIKKLNTVVLSLALLAAGCAQETKKEDPAPEQQIPVQNPAQKTCQLTSQQHTGDSYWYFSDSTGRVTRITHTHTWAPANFRHELLYNTDGNVAEIREYDIDNVQTGFRLYVYNADKLPQTIKFYSKNTAGAFTHSESLALAYNAAGQLIKKSAFSPSQTVPNNYSEFSYPAAGQVKEDYYAVSAGSLRLASTTLYGLDAKKSPYSLLNFYTEWALVTKNNITSFSQTNHVAGSSRNYTRTYEYNEEGFPVKETSHQPGSNFPVTGTWGYKCQ